MSAHAPQILLERVPEGPTEYVFAAPDRALETFLRAARTEGLGELVAWEPPDGAPSFAGAGVAVRFDGPDAALRERAAACLAGICGAGPAAEHFAPRAFAALAFDGGVPGWDGFPAASAVVPRWRYTRTARGATIALTLMRGETPDAFLPRLEKILRALESDAAPLPAPSARVTGRLSRNDWRARVAEVQSRIRAGALSKAVLAMHTDVESAEELDPIAILDRLRASGDHGWRFLASRGRASFLGLSPERLVSKRGAHIACDALAGTAAADAELHSSAKDLAEQQLVVEGIRASLAPWTRAIDVPAAPGLRRLRHLVHLHTPIAAMAREGTHVLDLVAALHPTPAVGGTPPLAARDALRSIEPEPRGWYAGAIGWFDPSGDGEFAVGIRSAWIEGTHARAYAGAGIVEGSAAAAELAEVELKTRGMLHALGVRDTVPPIAPATGGLHMEWAAGILDAFVSAGVKDLVVSPGSRSTPLTLAAVRDARLVVHDVVDERSAAFFALGAARATNRPVLLMCTSGTAGAHYFPALIEAEQSFVPLIAVTADRPLEHSACGASQSIDQVKLFGDHVRAFFELGVPDPNPAALAGARRMAVQAAATSLHPLPGPVHVNARFRKPLEPARDAELPKPLPALATAWIPEPAAPPPAAVRALAEACAGARRGLIACGPASLSQTGGRAAIHALAAATGFPLFAESASQLRHGPAPVGVVRIDGLDALLGSREFRRRHAPDLLLQIGAAPVSAGWARLVEENPGCARWVIAEHGWQDPHGSARGMVLADPARTAEALVAALPPRASGSGEWASSLALADAAARRAADVEVANGFWDGPVARAVLAGVPAGSLLAVGNSLPIRDLDGWCAASPNSFGVLHQRGASGIDGLVSGAAGAAAATGKPVTLFLGDVSFLHDLAGLSTVREIDTPLAIVVVNNGGGRIFERLPLFQNGGETEDTLAHWTTPHEADFACVAPLFGVRHLRVSSETALRAALDEAHRRRGCTVLEAIVPPHEGAARAARFQDFLEKTAKETEKGD